jgi:hypothetical protein
LIRLSGRADGQLAGLVVVEYPEVGEEDAQHHQKVPDLVAVAADVVLPGTVAFGTPEWKQPYLMMKI